MAARGALYKGQPAAANLMNRVAGRSTHTFVKQSAIALGQLALNLQGVEEELCTRLKLTKESAAALMVELLRFLIIKVDEGEIEEHGAVTSPSWLVDQAWHVFLTFTTLYRQTCNRLTAPDQMLLGHDPRSARRGDVAARYEHTYFAYARLFGQMAPMAQWPMPRDHNASTCVDNEDKGTGDAIAAAAATAAPAAAAGGDGHTMADDNGHATPDTLVVTVNSQDGNAMQFKLGQDTPFGRVKQAYINRIRNGSPADKFTFRFNGHPLEDDDTPRSLDMEDGDTIECMLHQQGC